MEIAVRGKRDVIRLAERVIDELLATVAATVWWVSPHPAPMYATCGGVKPNELG